MFVILVYDIGVKRVSKVLKVVRRYLLHRQKSVFEGRLTQSRLEQLQVELAGIILPEEDSVVIYRFDSLNYSQQILIGRQETNQDIL